MYIDDNDFIMKIRVMNKKIVDLCSTNDLSVYHDDKIVTL